DKKSRKDNSDVCLVDPVSLSCNHSFCSSCLQKFWEQTQSRNCPICKRKSSKDHLGVNFGEPKVFCKDDQRALCSVCDISQHQSHTVVPVEVVIKELKEELKSDKKYLMDRKNQCRRVEETLNQMIQHSKKQLLSTERQIRAQFNKLHQFLKEEEESRVAALREEEEQKRKTMMGEMKRIQEQMSSLSESISAVEAELQKDKEQTSTSLAVPPPALYSHCKLQCHPQTSLSREIPVLPRLSACPSA
uniref:RING-type domain-containing protein n=1 Tax=Oryzias latipes TaxID=8090 RepID=A0A3B3HBA6_ORYLA